MPARVTEIARELEQELHDANETVNNLGGDRDRTISKLYVALNARLAKLVGIDDATVAALGMAIDKGPWTDRQKGALSNLLEAIGTSYTNTEKQAYQHCMRHIARLTCTHIPCIQMHQ